MRLVRVLAHDPPEGLIERGAGVWQRPNADGTALDGPHMRLADAGEPLLHRHQHYVVAFGAAHSVASDRAPDVGPPLMCHRSKCSGARVENDGHVEGFPVPAGELETVRAPACLTGEWIICRKGAPGLPQDHDCADMGAAGLVVGVLLQKQAVDLHLAADAIDFGGRLAPPTQVRGSAAP